MTLTTFSFLSKDTLPQEQVRYFAKNQKNIFPTIIEPNVFSFYQDYIFGTTRNITQMNGFSKSVLFFFFAFHAAFVTGNVIIYMVHAYYKHIYYSSQKCNEFTQSLQKAPFQLSHKYLNFLRESHLQHWQYLYQFCVFLYKSISYHYLGKFR